IGSNHWAKEDLIYDECAYRNHYSSRAAPSQKSFRALPAQFVFALLAALVQLAGNLFAACFALQVAFARLRNWWLRAFRLGCRFHYHTWGSGFRGRDGTAFLWGRRFPRSILPG